eukprot:TRINITY_DN17048_c0_g1_i1.p1 TRINITY_DN17048_c0_g1~~TRINITY_DN17048_c0_g1_i1.p1  ORF type:complete len:151 (+),score=44.50 TRINITY_DN17048_c0_g1_i1:67-519(+)
MVMPTGGSKLKWTKMNLLGRGSFGTVYEGITNDGKLIAVKQMELPAEKIQDEEDGDVKALISEINLMAQLKHRHIVAYYGCQTTDMANGGKLFEIFLEHCHGGSLTSLRKKLSLIHISEPTRLLSISYAVFCLKKKKTSSQLSKLNIGYT